MRALGTAHVLLIGTLLVGTAPARAAADDAACRPTRGNARADDTAPVTLRLTLRWRAGDPVVATPSPATATTSSTTISSITSTSATAHRLPDPVELSTVNGQALSWSQTMLHNEPTWQAVWTAQGPGWVGGERPVAVVDQAWFCPHWPGGNNVVTVDFRISSDPLPAGADAAAVPRGWRRDGQVQAALGAWIPLSPPSGRSAEAGRGEQAASAGRRVATDEGRPALPVLEMRWLLEATEGARALAARPRPITRPVASRRPDRPR